MIGGLILAATQTVVPAAAVDLFMTTCVAGLADPAAFAAVSGRLGYVRVEERGRGALYRAGGSELLYTPNERCELRLAVEDRGQAEQVVGGVSASLGLPEPWGIAMHPPGWTRYRWPIPEGATPRFYLAAESRIDHQGAVSLDLSIHRGPAQ